MPGAERLRDSTSLKDLLKQQQAADRFVTAICAAPAVVLEAQGFLQGKKATSHPGFTDKLSDKRCTHFLTPLMRGLRFCLHISQDSEPATIKANLSFVLQHMLGIVSIFR